MLNLNLKRVLFSFYCIIFCLLFKTNVSAMNFENKVKVFSGPSLFNYNGEKVDTSKLTKNEVDEIVFLDFFNCSLDSDRRGSRCPYLNLCFYMPKFIEDFNELTRHIINYKFKNYTGYNNNVLNNISKQGSIKVLITFYDEQNNKKQFCSEVTFLNWSALKERFYKVCKNSSFKWHENYDEKQNIYRKFSDRSKFYVIPSEFSNICEDDENGELYFCIWRPDYDSIDCSVEASIKSDDDLFSRFKQINGKRCKISLYYFDEYINKNFLLRDFEITNIDLSKKKPILELKPILSSWLK